MAQESSCREKHPQGVRGEAGRGGPVVRVRRSRRVPVADQAGRWHYVQPEPPWTVQLPAEFFRPGGPARTIRAGSWDHALRIADAAARLSVAARADEHRGPR